ncbi:MAG: pilin [Algiphilus sp.]|nr:pilin [Algiphilus sp.]
MSEGLALLAPVKAAVVEYHAVHGHLPTSSNWLALLRELGLPVSTAHGAGGGSYVERIWWNRASGQIRVRYAVSPIAGRVLALTAEPDASGFQWRCAPLPGADGVPMVYLPASCRR